MTKINAIICAAVVVAFAAGGAQAADVAKGEIQYQETCAICHGERGISIAPIYPNVAGQKEPYLVVQMKAYRDGHRRNEIMAPMAQGLTNIDIVNIAAYVSRLRP